MDTAHLARLVPVLPEIVLGTGAAALLMLGAFRSGRAGRMVDYVAIALLAIAGDHPRVAARRKADGLSAAASSSTISRGF